MYFIAGSTTLKSISLTKQSKCRAFSSYHHCTNYENGGICFVIIFFLYYSYEKMSKKYLFILNIFYYYKSG